MALTQVSMRVTRRRIFSSAGLPLLVARRRTPAGLCMTFATYDLQCRSVDDGYDDGEKRKNFRPFAVVWLAMQNTTSLCLPMN
jgi:hypothetical protein